MWWVVLAALASTLAVALVRSAVGPQSGADGTYNLTSPRIDKTGSACVVQSGGKYGESSLRQLSFTAGDQGTGVAPPQTLSTVSIITLYNPAGNNQRLRVQRVSLAYLSGTLSSGPVYHCAIISTAQAAPSGGTLQTNVCLDIGSGAVGTGVVRTGATVAAGVKTLRPLCSLAPQLATSVLGAITVNDDVDGEFVVEPGASYHLQSVQAGAGTSPLVTTSVSWTEEPIK
jgi:hypothetical protein